MAASDLARRRVRTPMAIASASKWLYAAYAVQKVGGVAGLEPTRFRMCRSSTSRAATPGPPALGPGICGRDDTVQECVDFNNSTLDPGNLGLFNYDSGHMEVHAASRRIGLGPFGNLPLADAVLGTTTGSSNPGSNTYTEPLLAGGVQSCGGVCGLPRRACCRAAWRCATC